MVLVTGGTGLVGSHLLFELLQTETQVRAIYRRAHKLDLVKRVFSYYSEDFEALFNKIEWIEADITDIPKLEIAFEGVSKVYHCAAFVSFEPDKFETLRKINIEGTANIVNLCIAHKVEKMVHVSSIAAIGQPTSNQIIITEETAWNPEADNSVYAITKYGAELEVWRGSQEGLDVIIVNPGVVIGPGFWRSGSSGSIFTRVNKNNTYYTKGTSAYIDVVDVAKTMITLMNSSIKNEGYILIAENLTFKTFLDTVAKAINVPPTKKEANPWLLHLLWRLDWLKHKITDSRRRMTKQLVNSLTSRTTYDNSKIKGVLDFSFKDISKSIDDTAKWFLEDKK
ncbi:NAD-dependent epimerase/dehydratase family protein [Winogradskyella maritima]|uniref:NAD-dependent epimerase/dehydratase family protein n=1 Tax=Winogradskyella maritima TaxID=1517766 RepID=A0ABV8AER7_9FLAO|nr:NAD-dependent epimerase/dehydratase family protein [Winogradskyella maritima]